MYGGVRFGVRGQQLRGYLPPREEARCRVIIGVPKEIKTREYRVGMTPAGVRSLTLNRLDRQDGARIVAGVMWTNVSNE